MTPAPQQQEYVAIAVCVILSQNNNNNKICDNQFKETQLKNKRDLSSSEFMMKRSADFFMSLIPKREETVPPARVMLLNTVYYSSKVCS